MTLPYTSFSFERLTLPNEDAAVHRQLYDEWMAAYPCRGPIEQGFALQALVALLEKYRIEDIRATVRRERVRTAVLLFERRQEDEVARCLELFPLGCEYAMMHMLRTPAGCRWAIARWEELEKALADDGTWYSFHRLAAIQLQGLSAHVGELYLSEHAYITWIDCLVAQPNPKKRDIEIITDPKRIPKPFLERDIQLWPGNPAESRARLQALVDRELPRLRALEKTLRVQFDEPARAEAEHQALRAVTAADMPLLRSEQMHEQSYLRAVNAFIKVRKQSAAAPVPRHLPAARRELDESLPLLAGVVAGASRDTERPRPSG